MSRLIPHLRPPSVTTTLHDIPHALLIVAYSIRYCPYEYPVIPVLEDAPVEVVPLTSSACPFAVSAFYDHSNPSLRQTLSHSCMALRHGFWICFLLLEGNVNGLMNISECESEFGMGGNNERGASTAGVGLEWATALPVAALGANQTEDSSAKEEQQRSRGQGVRWAKMAELGAWRKLSGLTEWMKVNKQLRVGGNTSELPLAPVIMESLGFDLYSIDMVLQSVNSGLFGPFSQHPKLFHMLGHERKVQSSCRMRRGIGSMVLSLEHHQERPGDVENGIEREAG
ncbi:hypothetical protein BT96DRAFT_950923 [Gymnopus androsaceus JB14]|uniref:Uncharacterized protein n=1 Tax=Gymnopus androsaceus JB14 TaxID=1447944 RepID=A0A6A4GEG5_9AGAR|nr:hypothetical protein BT96DRAFT_950923 [Gymnopus androsaceus JB14]